MFNVSWSDPASETVAQRRERKERDERDSVQSSAASSLRSAESDGSSKNRSTHLPAPSNTARKSKQKTAPKSGLSLFKNSKLPFAGKRLSLGASGTSPDSQQTAKAVNRDHPYESSDHLRDSLADTIQSVPFSNGRSNTTGSSWSSVTGNSSKSFEIQTLAEKSHISKSTGLTTAPRGYTDILNTPMDTVSIGAEDPYSDEEFTIEMDGDIFRFPRVPGQSRPNGGRANTAHSPRSSESLTPMGRRPGEFWRPPTNWNCVPNDPNSPQRVYKLDTPRELSDEPQMASFNRATHTQRHIRRMQAANPRTILERMKEESTGIDDTIRKKLKFDKNLWMLTGLRYLAKLAAGKSEMVGYQEGAMALTANATSMPSKVLSLFESQASASFLAAFTTAAEIHHIATSPLPPCPIQHAASKTLPSCSHPHVYPLTIPNPQPHIPFGPHLFISISALSLPAILASSSIPTLLRDCHRILRPSGTLHLTILEPLPALATVGPRLRAWLEKHLVLNLEKHFRCLSPGRLFPIWLQEARFSCRATVMIEFWAVAKGDGGDLVELNAVVGRMLWKEMWGGFLDDEIWWWDDGDVMEECERMGTRWECALVEAVKA